MPKKEPKTSFIRRFFELLGPGIIAGAADDDPSGIATCSIAGAQHGLALLWTALLTWPLMAFIQMMCARIGMVSGRGLIGALRRRIPRPVLTIAAFALFVANSINTGADLSGMADAAETLTTINSHLFVIVFAAGIALATIFFRYHQIATILKWLALVLFAYVVTGFVIHPNWAEIARATFVPHWPRSHGEWSTLVAMLGTTISPYLFFWQASQGGGRESYGPPDVGASIRRHATRDNRPQDRHRCRHLLFQSGDLLYHFNDCAHPASSRPDRYQNEQRRRPSAVSNSG
jgi:NRAMP (natural resistance-associated macrophage protein)-like metal ion transporter